MRRRPFEAEKGGGAGRDDGQRSPVTNAPAERAGVEPGGGDAERREVPVDRPGNAAEVVAIGGGDGRLVVGVARHHRLGVTAGSAEENGLEAQRRGQEPLDRWPEA